MKKMFLCLISCLILLSGCQKKFSLLPYVSENRYAIYLGETSDVKVQANVVTREYPYLADGLIGDKSTLLEVSVILGEKPDLPSISFTLGDKTYAGELAYDTVSGKYSYSCTATPTEDVINFTVAGKTVSALKLSKEDRTERILEKIVESETETISSMRSGKYFLGEVYIRMIYDEDIYYYVGLVDQNGNVTSLLTNEEGNVLARRT